ncbi:MAG: hypothetical protein ACSHYF_18435 [Verrucomicrobiaceae bacterium]
MVLRLLAILLITLPAVGQTNWLAAPHLETKPVNQRYTNGIACGPACLLDAFQCGSEKWRHSASFIEGKSDLERLTFLIKTYAGRPSTQFPGQSRWNPKGGVNAVDLAAIANEMRKKSWMGTVKQSLFFKPEKQSSAKLLHNTHRQLHRSLSKGLPPILSIRRHAYRTPKGGKVRSWLTVKRHYVTLTGLPDKLPPNATSFPITYRDPWGGQSLTGTVKIADSSTQPLATLILDLPKFKVGRELIRRGEKTTLSLPSAIGLF